MIVIACFLLPLFMLALCAFAAAVISIMLNPLED
jgi:hypothetical protein